jgi:hypothetical protein
MAQAPVNAAMTEVNAAFTRAAYAASVESESDEEKE